MATSSESNTSRDAERIYSEYLGRLQEGRNVDFEDLCSKHRDVCNTYGDRNDLAELPRGTTTLSNTLFDARGLIQLASRNRTRFPRRVDGIAVGRRIRGLCVLHSTVDAARKGVKVGSLILHYTSGEPRELPIIYGKDLRDWHESRETATVDAEVAVVAWRGANLFAASRKRTLRLFKSAFDNPRPDSEVSSIDFVSALTSAAPFVVAMTVEDSVD